MSIGIEKVVGGLQHASFEPVGNKERIPNPEKGFYYPGLGFWAEHDFFNELNHVRGLGYTMAYVGVKLADYTNKEIDGRLIERMKRLFAAAREAGVKLILRFYYFDEFGGKEADLDRMRSHIKGISGVLKKNTDVISILQAGFLGKWGEWHESALVDKAEARKTIIKDLMAIVSSTTIRLQLRTPSFISECVEASGGRPDLCGFHNDCIGADETDMDTYHPDAPWFWKHYARIVTGPVGGETCIMGTDTGFEPFMDHARKFRISFLNGFYSDKVIDEWKSRGRYEEIERNIGYDLSIKDAWWTAKPKAGGLFEFKTVLKNNGVTVPYNRRPVYLVFDGPKKYTVLLREDVTKWSPGKDHEMDAKMILPEKMVPGGYRLALWIPDAAESIKDDPRFTIRFSNVGMWDADEGMNIITNVTVL